MVLSRIVVCSVYEVEKQSNKGTRIFGGHIYGERRY
jgi:hypothetical protein